MKWWINVFSDVSLRIKEVLWESHCTGCSIILVIYRGDVDDDEITLKSSQCGSNSMLTCGVLVFSVRCSSVRLNRLKTEAMTSGMILNAIMKWSWHINRSKFIRQNFIYLHYFWTYIPRYFQLFENYLLE